MPAVFTRYDIVDEANLKMQLHGSIPSKIFRAPCIGQILGNIAPKRRIYRWYPCSHLYLVRCEE